MNQTIELGLDTFGDITDGPDGEPLHAAQVIRNLVEEAVLADEVGVDFIGVGEHHRADRSTGAAVLVAAGGRSSGFRWHCLRKIARQRSPGGAAKTPSWRNGCEALLGEKSDD